MKVGLTTLCASALAALVLAVAAPAASAATVYAGPGAASSSFLTPNVSISAGGTLSFTNLDLVGHDVTSQQTTRPRRRRHHHHHHHRRPAPPQPLFKSATVGFGSMTPVNGVEKLQPGSYPFFCSIHPTMTGVLTVH
jgi:plastocyanin